MSRVWVVDAHVDTGKHRVFLTATDRATGKMHIEPLIGWGAPFIQAVVGKMIAEHGAPDAVQTDHGVLFSGLGEAVGVPQIYGQPANPSWLKRLAALAERLLA